MWHIARAEDIMLNTVLTERAQVLDDGWPGKLRVDRRDFGIGMTKAEVDEVTRQIDLGALRDYRDAVGRRTREIIGGFGDKDWEGQATADALERAASQGAFGGRAPLMVQVFTGRPRVAVISGIALFHPTGHMGEAATIRSAGGFGTGI